MIAQDFGRGLAVAALDVGEARALADAVQIAAAWNALPGVTATTDGSLIRVAGPGIPRRMLTDPRLAWPGAFLS